MRCIISGVPFGPRAEVTGSPGKTRMMKNTRVARIKTIGKVNVIRVRIKRRKPVEPVRKIYTSPMRAGMPMIRAMRVRGDTSVFYIIEKRGGFTSPLCYSITVDYGVLVSVE
jgi:hypothetical protein